MFAATIGLVSVRLLCWLLPAPSPAPAVCPVAHSSSTSPVAPSSSRSKEGQAAAREGGQAAAEGSLLRACWWPQTAGMPSSALSGATDVSTTLAGCRQLGAATVSTLCVTPPVVLPCADRCSPLLQKHPELQLFCNDWTYVRYLRARWVVWQHRLASTATADRRTQSAADRSLPCQHAPSCIGH